MNARTLAAMGQVRMIAVLVAPQHPTPVCITGRDDVPTHCTAGRLRRRHAAITRAISQSQKPRSA